MNRLPLLGFFLLALNGCGTATKPERSSRPAIHRFAIVNRNPDVAFDTQTGQICKTSLWQPVGEQAKPDPAGGGTPERIRGEFTPLCLDLYNKYPSGLSQPEPPGTWKILDDEPTAQSKASP